NAIFAFDLFFIVNILHLFHLIYRLTAFGFQHGHESGFLFAFYWCLPSSILLLKRQFETIHLPICYLLHPWRPIIVRVLKLKVWYLYNQQKCVVAIYCLLAHEAARVCRCFLLIP